MRVELSDVERQEAEAYLEAIVARAEGRENDAVDTGGGERRTPLLARLVPGAVKRGVVRALIYLMRHPFDHLAHPLQTRLEEEIGQARGIAQAALARAERSAAEVQRLKAQLERERRGR
jgi:hypothetical protein